MRAAILALAILLAATSAGAQAVEPDNDPADADARIAGKLFIDIGVQPASVKCDRRDPGVGGKCWIQCGRLVFIGDPNAPDGTMGEWRWRSLCRQIRRLFLTPTPTPVPTSSPRPTARPTASPTPFPLGNTPCERGAAGWCMVWSPTTFNTVCLRCNL